MNIDLATTKSASTPTHDNLANDYSFWTILGCVLELQKWGMNTAYARQHLTSTNRGELIPLIRNSGSFEAEGMS